MDLTPPPPMRGKQRMLMCLQKVTASSYICRRRREMRGEETWRGDQERQGDEERDEERQGKEESQGKEGRRGNEERQQNSAHVVLRGKRTLSLLLLRQRRLPCLSLS
jgi:hypothetical protein